MTVTLMMAVKVTLCVGQTTAGNITVIRPPLMIAAPNQPQIIIMEYQVAEEEYSDEYYPD